MLGSVPSTLSSVNEDACQACCREVRLPEQGNPVIASLLYSVADAVVQDGGHPNLSLTSALQLRHRATDLLTLDLPVADQQFPPAIADSENRRRPEASQTSCSGFAVGLLTAPRADPQIAGTIESLDVAGFDQLNIFAEPGSQLPEPRAGLQVFLNSDRLGNIRNFCTALARLREIYPLASAYAVFQDDIRAARGLREWFEQQLWPLDTGIVSLFTPRVHSDLSPGWHGLSPGVQRVCGAQALVFRPDVLDQFLADPMVIRCAMLKQHGDDAVLGGWIGREQLKIAYHTPSLVQHVGHVSSIYIGGPDQRNMADAVDDVSHLVQWTHSQVQVGSIGLVGWNTPTGLGVMNRDLARHLSISRWLIPDHPELQQCDEPLPVGVEPASAQMVETGLNEWLEPLDWLLFVERPLVDGLPRMAAHKGLGVACIPMWEWIQPHHPWLQFVDVMLCPTRRAFELMEDWKVRYGFGWKCVLFNWPVDTTRFSFRQRKECRQFLFVNGWGGGMTVPVSHSEHAFHRKGLEVMIAAASMAPELQFVFCSQAPLPVSMPSNVIVRPALRNPGELYDIGDVCVQPSHYEGLGLQLLECQAAGMPLVTTDAPPMNEHHPWRTISLAEQETVRVGDGYISSAMLRPDDLVATLRQVVGQDISVISQASRNYVVNNHNWSDTIEMIRHELRKR